MKLFVFGWPRVATFNLGGTGLTFEFVAPTEAPPSMSSSLAAPASCLKSAVAAYIKAAVFVEVESSLSF